MAIRTNPGEKLHDVTPKNLFRVVQRRHSMTASHYLKYKHTIEMNSKYRMVWYQQSKVTRMNLRYFLVLIIYITDKRDTVLIKLFPSILIKVKKLIQYNVFDSNKHTSNQFLPPVCKKGMVLKSKCKLVISRMEICIYIHFHDSFLHL